MTTGEVRATTSAQTSRSIDVAIHRAGRSGGKLAGGVVTFAMLADHGVGRDRLRAQLAARRWQRRGTAIVLHNGPLDRRQGWLVALINAGPRAGLTAFTAAEHLGLTGWERNEIHVVTPLGVAPPAVAGLSIRLHRSTTWNPPSDQRIRRCERLAPALIRAAGTFSVARPACGLLAAAVQQRLVEASALAQVLAGRPKLHHRAALVAALADIEGGSHALSEIDFVRLCRRYRLPEPERQAIRLDSAGRRRYLDATWRGADGRSVVVEVDGALHLSPRRWWADQYRQNELAIAGALVLRFPSVIVRTEADVVAQQLARALGVSCSPRRLMRDSERGL